MVDSAAPSRRRQRLRYVSSIDGRLRCAVPPPATASLRLLTSLVVATVRRRVFRHPGRVAVVVVALLVVLNLSIILLNNSDTSVGGRPALPVAIESISPERGDLTTLIATINVDLRNDLTGVLVVDGIEIPEDQLDRVVALGEISFRPGPDKEFSKLRTGTNQVVVKYWSRKLTKRPANPASYGWSFEASA
jgi:hypothetical protein